MDGPTAALSMIHDAEGQRVGRTDAANDTFVVTLVELGTGFTGHTAQPDAGLINMRGRMYDPHAARFVQRDPVVAAAANGQAYNRCAYVQNRPLRPVDPSGYAPEEPDDGGPPAGMLQAATAVRPTGTTAMRTQGPAARSQGLPYTTTMPSTSDGSGPGSTATDKELLRLSFRTPRVAMSSQTPPIGRTKSPGRSSPEALATQPRWSGSRRRPSTRGGSWSQTRRSNRFAA